MKTIYNPFYVTVRRFFSRVLIFGSDQLTVLARLFVLLLYSPPHSRHLIYLLPDSLRGIHRPPPPPPTHPRSQFPYTFFLPSLVQSQVVEMNYLRSPGMSPDFLHPIRDVCDALHYFKWSLPLSMEFVYFTQFQL